MGHIDFLERNLLMSQHECIKQYLCSVKYLQTRNLKYETEPCALYWNKAGFGCKEGGGKLTRRGQTS